MTLQDLMMVYGVTLGKRRSKKQRYLFGLQLKESMNALGWQTNMQLPDKKKAILRVENVVVGDLKRAKTVFVAPFDTPTKALIPCRYFPFHPELTINEEKKDLLLQGLIGLLLIITASLPTYIALTRKGWDLLWLIPAVLLCGLAIWIIKGRTNTFNFNRSSASVAVCAKLAEDLAGSKNVAFAFCDRATTSYEGYKLLAKELSPNQTVVLLDCIAQGDQLVLAHGTLANLKAKRLMELLPVSTLERTYADDQVGRNLLSLFPAGIVLTSGTIEGGELVVHNTRTPKDIGLDLPRLECIEKALSAFAQGK